MKNRMRGRTQESFREGKEMRCPGSGCDHDGVAANPMSIFQDNAMDPVIVFVERDELGALAQFHPARFRMFEESGDHATAFDVTGVGIEEAILKSFRCKRWKPLVERERIESFDAVLAFLQNAAALVFKLARLHCFPANKQDTGFVVELDAELSIPLSPNFNTALRERGVILVCAISRSDCFADIGRSGSRMGQGAGVYQDDFVAALF